MTRIHLATALVRRDDAVLLVASRYPNHPEPLWNMPGGRQQPGELLTETALRELYEETGLTGRVRELCYASESYDGEIQFNNFTFAIEASGDRLCVPKINLCPAKSTPRVEGDHVVQAQWVPRSELERRLTVRVVREPLLAYLDGTLTGRYAGYPDAGITIEFPD